MGGRWAQNEALLTRIRDYCEQFQALQPVRSPQALPVLGVTFAEGASVLAGAAVVADLTGANSGCAERVVVWHCDRWDGLVDDVDSPGAELTATQTPYDRWSVPADFGGPPQLGMYNARVPTLCAVEVRQHPASDGAVVTLVTAESDYRSTEPLADRQSPQCKKLVPDGSDRWMRTVDVVPVFTGEPTTVDAVTCTRLLGAHESPWRGEGRDPRRGTLLNVVLGLIAVGAEGRRDLVLMQRSTRTSNAAGELGPTSGGVIELANPRDRRDSDRFGAVDPVAGIRRELHEELGLGPDDCTLAVHAVYLSNSLGPASSGGENRTGQLVSTVLAIGTTHLDETGFRRRRHNGSPSAGLYESRGLVFVPMGSTADDFARSVVCGGYDEATLKWLGEMPSAAGVRRVRDLEQSALLVALYASSSVFGPGETLVAFRRAFGDMPFWSFESPETARRVCRPPRDLWSDPRLFDGWFDAFWKATGP